jgi:DNA-binding MarR family transcriptional regulator
MSKTQIDLSSRFGFLVADVGRLYSRAFDRYARDRLGLTRAQLRLLSAIVTQPSPPNQVAMAEFLEMTPMGVTALCDRMEAAGWIRREADPTDRRAKILYPQPKAHEAFAAAMRIGDIVQRRALGGLDTARRQQLIRLLKFVHANLSARDTASEVEMAAAATATSSARGRVKALPVR